MFKKELSSLSVYSPSQRFAEGEYPICLDWNEGPFGVPEGLQRMLIELVKKNHLNRYPGISDYTVEHRLTGSLGVPEGSVAIYNGSDAALQELLACVIWSGRSVFYVEPEYSQSYQFAQLYGAQVKLVRPADIFSKTDAIAELGLTTSDVLYLSNPCNPTGSLISKDEVEQILKTGVCLILDEAYVDFSNSSAATLTQKYKNIFVLRTFSKAFGLAGLRAGYICSHPDNVRELNKVRNVKQVSDAAKLAMIWALDNVDVVRKNIKEIKIIREFVSRELLRFSTLEVFSSTANFLLVRADRCGEFISFCKNRGVLIRDRQDMHGLSSCFRVSIGTKCEMDSFIKLVREFYEV